MTATADETVVALVKIVIVVVEVAHGHHTLTVVLVDLAVDAERLYAGDVGIKLLAEVVAHKLYHLIFYRVALSVGCHLLHVAAVFTQLLIVVLVGRPSSLLIARDESVHHGVGVTAYGRCEVGVIVERQTEVADVVNAVFCFHHGPQRHELYDVALGFALTRVHELVQRACRGSLCALRLHLVAELDHKLAQRLELLRVGVVVHTIGQRLCRLALLHLAHALCHGAVGEQHKLLDELVGVF